MRKKILLIGVVFIHTLMIAQEDAWVYLTDKASVESLLANPLDILTQKAIDRKLQQGIPIDASDVPVNEAYISQLKQQAGVEVLAKSKWFNTVFVRGEIDAINALSDLSFVDYIDFADENLNSESRVTAPDDKFNIEETQVDFVYGNSLNQVEMIDVNLLHQQDFTGEGVTVAVLDAGFVNVNTMGAFQRLRDNGNLLNGYDFVDRNTNVYAFQGNSHGTRVLSDMAAFIEDEFVGTAPDASYYLFRTEDVASETPVEEAYWVEAAERADSLGVNIINSSLGYKTYNNPNHSHLDADLDGNSTFVTRGANMAFLKGILVVNSAGNSGVNGVGAPADGIHVFSIGAVDADGMYAEFSSQGSDIQPTIKPDVMARGQSAFVVSEENGITQNNGTSFSSPIMAGAMACLMQALPDATIEQLKQFVRESSSQFENPDYMMGYGIPNFDSALNIGLSVLEEELTAFEVFPNPVNSVLFVRFPHGLEQAELNVYDVLGKRILRANITNSNNQINTSGLASGMYLLNVKSPSISKTIKLIKS